MEELLAELVLKLLVGLAEPAVLQLLRRIARLAGVASASVVETGPTDRIGEHSWKAGCHAIATAQSPSGDLITERASGGGAVAPLDALA